MQRYFKKVLALLFIGFLFINMQACSKSSDISKSDKTKLNVVALKGPTGIGLVNLMESSEQNKTQNDYDISIVGDPSEAAAKLVSHNADIALLPTNMASILYNKASGDINVAAVNTLGVLYLVTRDNTIKNISDLKGKTVYLTGQGATPEFAFNYILSQNGLNPNIDVKVEYKAEHAELVTLMLLGKVDIGILPEPFVTQVTNKDDSIKLAFGLTEEWYKVSNNSDLTMGCIAVNKELINEKKAALDIFLDEYKVSSEFANTDISKTAKLCDKYGIMLKEIAEKAIPKCNLVFIRGNEMKTKITNFFNVLFKFDPKSIGGKLPDENFYY